MLNERSYIFVLEFDGCKGPCCSELRLEDEIEETEFEESGAGGGSELYETQGCPRDRMVP